MVKRKIVWSYRAKTSLFSILNFYTERNKSSTYSKKLYKKLNKEIALLIKQPNIGIQTEIETVRGLIIDEFIVYYETGTDEIFIHLIWDCRQDPKSLKIL